MFRQLRDAAAAIQKKADEEIAKVKGSLKVVENELSARLQKDDVQAIRTASGTVYREEVIYPRATDWGIFYQWIKENDAFHFLEKRIGRRAVADHLTDGEEVPPGLDVTKTFEVRVRKS